MLDGWWQMQFEIFSTALALNLALLGFQSMAIRLFTPKVVRSKGVLTADCATGLDYGDEFPWSPPYCEANRPMGRMFNRPLCEWVDPKRQNGLK